MKRRAGLFYFLVENLCQSLTNMISSNLATLSLRLRKTERKTRRHEKKIKRSILQMQSKVFVKTHAVFSM